MHYLSEPAIEGDRPLSQSLIKEENKKCLFNLLNKRGEMARTELVRLTGLSPTTVSALVEELEAEGFVLETGYAKTPQIGRKPINLRINASARQIPVFTFCREGLGFALYNLRAEVLERLFLPHDAARYVGFSADRQSVAPEVSEAYIALMEEILSQRSQLYDRQSAAAICICFPGAFLKDQRLISLASMRISLSADALKALEQRLGTPIFIGNVSQAMAYAEKKRMERCGLRVDDLIYVNVSSFVDAGVIYKGDVFSGNGGFAGEIGHVTINYRGNRCVCGGRGCLENYVNLHAILERISQAARLSHDGSLLEKMQGCNGKLTLDMVRAADEAGETDVAEALNDIALQLFSAIYSMACVTGICNIVLGGGIERLGSGFLQRMRSLAGKDMENRLLPNLNFSYGKLRLAEAGIGIAEYFIDKRFSFSEKKWRRSV